MRLYPSFPGHRALASSAVLLLASACTGKTEPVNTAPTCTITAPTDGEVFLSGADETLTADIADADGDTPTSIYWTTTASGPIADGAATDAVLPDGAQIVTVQASDGHGNDCSASVSIVVDQAPTVTVQFPLNLAKVASATPLGLSALVTDPNDVATDLVVSWTDSVAGALGSSNAGNDGVATLVAQLASPGPHTLTATVTDPAGATAVASVDVSVDSPPGAPTLAISPGSPATADDLVASVTADSVDADGDAVTYSWLWYLNGTLSDASTTDTLPASATTKGDVWTARAVPNDGVMDGVAGEASVTIGDTAPTMLSLTLSPDPLHSNENATAVPVAEDVDGDTITYTWVWGVDGRHVIDTADSLGGFNFSRGQTVKATATPSDGELSGDPMAASVVVVNSPPDNVVLSVTNAPIVGLTDIVCSVTNAGHDADGDPIALTFAWTVDGTAFTDTTTTVNAGDTVPAAATSEGEVWTCSVTPNDGYEDGVAATSSATVRACAGGDVTCPVADCQAALDGGGSGGDGLYWLDIDGTLGAPVQAWCDMTHADGGWTLVESSSDDGVATFTWDNTALTDDVGTADGTGDYRGEGLAGLGFVDLLAVHAPSGVWASYSPGTGGTLAEFLAGQPTDPVTASPMVDGTLAVAGTLCSTDLGYNVVDASGGGDSYGPTWSVDPGTGCGTAPGANGGIGPDEADSLAESPARGFGAALGLNTGTPGAGENRIAIYVR